MKDALLVLAVTLLAVAPYALITLGVYALTAEIGWAMITLGGLILGTVFAVGMTRG